MASSSSTASSRDDGDESQVEITSSRHMTESVTAAVTFEVTNAAASSMGNGESLRSRVFGAGGYDWQVRLYPQGPSGYDDDNPLTLYYLSQASHVRAEIALAVHRRTKGLKDQESQKVAGYGPKEKLFYPGEHCRLPLYLEMSYGSHGRPRLRALSEFGGGDGCFTVRCALTVVSSESPPLELPVDLECMLWDGTGADVTFLMAGSGHELRAHRALLAARSPVFQAQFFGPMAEKDMGRVEVVDVDPAVFQMMLHYVYTDSLPQRDEEEEEGRGGRGGGYGAAAMQHLLVAADRYGMERLKRMCEEELCKRIDVDAVMSTWALADRYGCRRLKRACVAFMASSPDVLGDVLESDEFKENFVASNWRPLALEGGATNKRSRQDEQEEIDPSGKSKRIST